MHVLNCAKELSTSEIISSASGYVKSFGISEDGFEHNMGAYLRQLRSLDLIEVGNDNKYAITSQGERIYSLFDIPFNHVADIASNRTNDGMFCKLNS